MRTVVTGSLGRVAKPLVHKLIAAGHEVTVVSHSDARKNEVESLGAKSAIRSVLDAGFLTSVFKGADAVFCMLPGAEHFFTDPTFDLYAYGEQVANSYLTAIKDSGVKRVVYLSTVGAHTPTGNGILRFHYLAENILRGVPKEVSLTCLRPVGFYTNLFRFIGGIKARGVITTNYGGDSKKPWVAPEDIGSAAFEEMTKLSGGSPFRYVASDEVSCNEIAEVLGQAIGKPDLKWQEVSADQVKSGMIAAGFSPQITEGMVEMNGSIQSGKIYENYMKHQPVLGKVKLSDFAIEFAAAFSK